MSDARRLFLSLVVGLIIVFVAIGEAAAQVHQAEIVVAVGDTLPGLTDPVVQIINGSNNGLGQVGFAGRSGPGGSAETRFIWANGELQLEETGTMNVADTGVGNHFGFFLPGSDRTLWSHNGVVISEGDVAPFILPQMTIESFGGKLKMTDAGQEYFLTKLEEDGGGETAHAAFVSPTASAGDFQLVIATGDVLPGSSTSPPGTVRGLAYPWDISKNGAHSIFVTSDASDDHGYTYGSEAVVVDGVFVARKHVPTSDDDDWAGFSSSLVYPEHSGSVSISNGGDYFILGSTDAPVDSNEIIVFNDQVVLREGDSIDGRIIGSPRKANVNSAGEVVLLLSDHSDRTLKWLYFSKSADLRKDAFYLMGEGDLVDTNGDGSADWVIESIGNVYFSEVGSIYLFVDLYFQETVPAILEIAIPVVFWDDFENGDTSGWDLISP